MRQNEETREYVPTKEKDKASEKEQKEAKISNLPVTEFKLIVIKVLIELGRIDEHNENFNKETENISKY